MGFNFELPVNKNIGVDVGIGTGQWSNVGYAGAKYYLQPCHRGLHLARGYLFTRHTCPYLSLANH